DAVAVGDVGQALGRGDGVGALVAAGRRQRVTAAIVDGVDAHAIVPWKRTRAPAMLVRGFAGAIWGFPQLTGARLSPSPPQSAPGGPGFLLPAATARAPSPRRGAARWQRPPADWLPAGSGPRGGPLPRCRMRRACRNSAQARGCRWPALRTE